MAVISKVPTEVLNEIFHLLCTKSVFVSELNNSYCHEDFPWAVGLVCRHWRTTFLSYPPIWASLKLSDNDSSQIANSKPRSESSAKEINRRLALYLERSGGYPLRLDISLWYYHNEAFTMMALEMLAACSHRWQSAKLYLFRSWHLDSILPACKGKLPILEWLDIRVFLPRKHALGIFEVAPRLTHVSVGPWAKDYGWILPWTQLTEVIITCGGPIIEDSDVPSLLPMLHNIKEFRFRLDCVELEFEDNFPQIAPTPLNQLRVLEVPHPTFLSWFEAPSLCDLFFRDYQHHCGEPLDVRGKISSLIQRSDCKIRKLSFESGRKFYVGTLKDVEELVIDYTHSDRVRSSIDISSLPNLRLLTIICSIHKDFESSMNSLTTALESARLPTRNECSSGPPVSLLERVIVELHYYKEQRKIPKRLLKIAEKWPAVVVHTQRS